MSVRITVLCDNSVGPISGTLGEHGFSALVEQGGGETILFDTGQGHTLLHNADRMKKDLSRVGKVVISHGHFDHAGGIIPLLERIGGRDILAHPGIFTPRHALRDSGESYPVGLPLSRGEYEAKGARFGLEAGYRQIAEGVFLTGEVPRLTAYEKGDQGLFCGSAEPVLDTTPDDQSLAIETPKGLVILLGCCHAGLVNTLEWIIEKSGRRDIYGVIGGTHLGFCGQEQLDKTIKSMRTYGIRKLAVSHCTGFAAAARLSREFAREFHAAMVGFTLEV